MALTIPAPTLVRNQAIDLTCGPVLDSDGRVLDANGVKAWFVTYRRDAQGTVMAWDTATSSWIAGAPANPEPLPPSSPRQNTPGVWAAKLMPVGKDAARKDKFRTDPAALTPVYFVRCTFETGPNDARVTDVSPASADVQILSQSDSLTAGVAVDPEPPDQAVSVTLFLGSPRRAHLSLAGGAVAAELSAAGATVRILQSGRIELTPGTGQTVVVEGPLDARGGLFVDGQPVQVP